MTASNKWVRERAERLRDELGEKGADFLSETNAEEPIATALQEAIERGEKNVTSRLENPDEAMGRAVLAAIEKGDPDAFIGSYDHRRLVTVDGRFDISAICRALALTLTGQEGENTDG